MTAINLNRFAKINLKSALVNMGVNFNHYSQSKISAYRDNSGKVWVNLPGIYSAPICMNNLSINL